MQECFETLLVNDWILSPRASELAKRSCTTRYSPGSAMSLARSGLFAKLKCVASHSKELDLGWNYLCTALAKFQPLVKYCECNWEAATCEFGLAFSVTQTPRR